VDEGIVSRGCLSTGTKEKGATSRLRKFLRRTHESRALLIARILERRVSLQGIGVLAAEMRDTGKEYVPS
jgi:hypothetical protein